MAAALRSDRSVLVDVEVRSLSCALMLTWRKGKRTRFKLGKLEVRLLP